LTDCSRRTTGSTSAAASSRRRSAASPGGAIARPTGRRTIAAGGSTICGHPPSWPATWLPTRCWSRAAAGSGRPTMCPRSASSTFERHRQLERAIAALKSGAAGANRHSAKPLTIASVETADREILELARPALGGAAADQRPARGGAVARQSPRRSRPPTGPLQAAPLQQEREAAAALKLARLAGLLPALWVIESASGAVSISIDEVVEAAPQVSLVARSKLPLEDMPETQIAAFRASDDGQEHVALVVGAFGGQAAARPITQRMSDRRRVRLAEMRLRAAASGGASAHRQRPAAGSCFTFVRRAAGSDWPTS
jgi:hypothetical protein